MSTRASRRVATLFTAVLTGALLLTGCVSDAEAQGGGTAAPQRPLSELEILEDPRSYKGPSTAVLPASAIKPIAEDPEQQLPSIVTSYSQGGGEEQVTVELTDRVIAVDIAGSIAASVWALGFGDTLAGVDQSTTFSGTEHIETVTAGGHTVNAETIIGLKPDVVITDGTVGPRDVIEQLRDVGITVVFVKNEASFEGAQHLVRQVAAIYGAGKTGEQLAERIGQEIEDKIAEVRELVPSEENDRVRMLFLYLRGNAGVYYLFGSESGADELIAALGGVDVAGELGWEGMKPMTDEALVAANPDLILTMTGGLESVGGVDGLLQEKTAVAVTAAGEHRRIVDMDDGTILSFGPRSSEVLDALARAVYAPDTMSVADHQ